MKNLRKIPSNVYFSNLLSDIKNKDYTSSFEVNSKDYLNITFPILNLIQEIDNNNNAVTNRHVPIQTNDTYNSFYQYYNYADNTIKSKSDIKNNYPISSWYPTAHEDQVGEDGTISIDMKTYPTDNLEITVYQEYNTVPKEQQDDSPQDYITTLRNITIPETADGFKIVNNLSFDDHSKIANNDYQTNKYSGSYSYEGLYNGSSVYELEPAYFDLNVSISNMRYNISRQENEGLYIYYKLIDTKEISKNNDIFEQEISYNFNSEKWINVIQGYLYNFKQYAENSQRIYPPGDDRRYYATFNYLHCDTSYFLNNYTEDDDHFDEIILTVYSFNETLNDQIPIGNRNLFSPDIIDLEKILPIKPTYTKSIKLVITQKYNFDGVESDNTATLNDTVYKNINGELINAKYAVDRITNTLQYKRCAACSKFLPGFNVDLITDNKGVYHTQYDTRSFARFKDYEIEIPYTSFITGRIFIKDNSYYPYLYNMNYNNNILQFYVNTDSYRHSDILYKGIDNVDVSLITYDYNNIIDYNDSTVVESYNYNNINTEIITDFTTDFSSYIDNYFIDIKLNYQQDINNVINFMSKLNYYTDVYNNYEYNFKIPQLNSINNIKRILTYEYDSDSTIAKEIIKENTNNIFINKNISEFKINNVSNISDIYIQITELSNNNIINEKWFDGTTYVNTFNSLLSYSLVNGINTITLTDFTADNNTDYILIFITDNNCNQSSSFDYNNTIKMDMSYTIPTKFTLTDINNISEANSIIQNNDIFTYKLQYIKKV